MGKDEENNSPKCDLGSQPAQQFPVPSSYLSTSLPTGHVPQIHMWPSQQPFMPPYGMPYPMIYPQGIVYAHPAVSLAAVTSSVELVPKPSEAIDQNSAKRLKGHNGLAVPITNDNFEVNAEGSVHGTSQSDDIATSTDESNEGMEDPKTVEEQPSLNRTPEISFARNAVRFPIEVSVQDERQLKREKRKQANRESARRSRLRKQAEYEEVVRRYESLNKDNTNLKSEMNKLKEDMEKLRLENATLMEKLESTQPRQPGEADPNDPNVKLEDSCNKK
nr:G-box-binding factor 3-like isoform X2 [Ipomoea batatas]